jgi:aldose sugar dehydrogenase
MMRLSRFAAALFCLTLPAVAQPTGKSAETFAQLCATCHGPQGRGGSGPSLVDDTWVIGSDGASLRQAINEGNVEKGMPGFKAALGEQEVNGLIAYLKSEYNEAKLHGPLTVPMLPDTAKLGFTTEVVVEGIKTPWALDWLPDGTMLITEKEGRLRLYQAGRLSEPVRGIPEVDTGGQGGLLDVGVHPDYAKNGWVYLAYAHPGKTTKGRKGAMTRLIRGKLADEAWVDEQVIWEAPASSYKSAGGVHFGCRIVFDGKGHVFFSHGERGAREDAQDLSLPNGKIHRVNEDGSLPADNPFVNTPGALPSIWTYGNRNPQGLVRDPRSGILWETEHGPKGGDELNLLLPGRNYGWPVITYGIDYDGTLVSPLTEKEGMEQPRLYWTPSLAVCGMAYYGAETFPTWKGSLLVSSLAKQELRRVVVDGDRVLGQELLLSGIGRLRDVQVGPDGFIYLAVNEPDRIVRIKK